ncbi:MAG: paraslipin, partial [Elusimicrobiota bacterium]
MQQIPVPLVVVIVVLLFIFAKMALRIIRPFEKGLVEFLGKFNRTVGSGLAFVIPMFETIRKVDMREQVLDVPPQDVITKDNVAVTVDAIIYFKVTDPFKVLYNVANFIQAAINLAQTNLRNVIGELALDETLTSRLKINSTLREVLDEATDAWGVKVTRVELRKIEPPADITQAMSRQMKAEREKRANIL